MNITACAPTRVDLAGGTLDLWPVQHLLEKKATVNVGVTLEAQVSISLSDDDHFHFTSQDQGLEVKGNFENVTQTSSLPLLGLLLKAIWDKRFPPIKLVTSAKSPAGAGLGGSSCLAVTVAGALLEARNAYGNFPKKNDHELVQLVQDVEAKLIHAPTGCQDYWGALRGNINILRFPFGGTDVQTLPASKLTHLANQMLLCYSGKSRASAINNWEIFKRAFDGDKALIKKLEEIGDLAETCAQHIIDGNIEGAISLSQQEWECRTKLWPSIETIETKALDQAAKNAGARFSRVCGAGGGGVMVVFCPEEKRAQVQQALTQSGGTVLDTKIAEKGLSVT